MHRMRKGMLLRTSYGDLASTSRSLLLLEGRADARLGNKDEEGSI